MFYITQFITSRLKDCHVPVSKPSPEAMFEFSGSYLSHQEVAAVERDDELTFAPNRSKGGLHGRPCANEPAERALAEAIAGQYSRGGIADLRRAEQPEVSSAGEETLSDSESRRARLGAPFENADQSTSRGRHAS